MDTAGKTIEIITGRYGKGTTEQNETVDSILGEAHGKERFEVYFHWYNLIHELGHGIMYFNAENRPHPVDEEQLVNDFAVAYWLYYGEEEKINCLKEIVSYALEHLKCPVGADISYIDYAKENWGKQEFCSFNNYGWFQFNCVAASLRKRRSPESVLSQMGIKNVQVQPRKALVYSVLTDDTIALKLVEDAAEILREWGAILPDVCVTFDNDPNRHMCKTTECK